MDKKTVAIFGAGIAGMSAAHELAKAGYDVHIYEYSSTCGGQAKSERRSNGLPSEYSWRGYGQFYKNVYKIMQEIPIDGATVNFETSSSVYPLTSVYDTELSKPIQFILVKDQYGSPTKALYNAENWTQNVSFKQWIKLGLQFARQITSDKRLDYYSSINAREWMGTKLDKSNTKSLSSVFAPWIGISDDRLSLHHAVNFFRMIKFPDLNGPYVHQDDNGAEWVLDSGSQWSVLRRPTNESWFDPWMRFLMNEYNVKFYFNSKLIRLNETNGIITNAQVLLLKENKLINIQADYYIVATTPFAVADIVANSSPVIKNDPQLKLFNGLTQDGPHIQVSFRIGFSEHVNLPKTHMAFILTDSEYNITFYFQNGIWHPDVYLGPGIQSLISGTACVSYVPGELYGKTLMELTKEEFEDEILHQIYKSDNLDAIIREYNDGKGLRDFEIVEFECWSGWKFGTNGEQLSQKENEKKWVNSTTTNLYMPSIRTSFPNLFLAGAHVKSSVDLYSMETACATGRQAAFYIINKNQRALVVNKPAWANALSTVDNGLYKARLPNVIDVIIIAFTIIFLIVVFRKLSKSK